MPDSGTPLTLWRAFVPCWAHAPLSGAGAARFGGRWNPVGAETIYAALELSTAWAEYNQGFVQHQALIAQLELSRAVLADLTEPAMFAELAVPAGIHVCAWRADLDRNEQPATHKLRERLLLLGYDGVIYPSVMSPGGTCIALWRWGGSNQPVLDVIDPEGRLPGSPASWL